MELDGAKKLKVLLADAGLAQKGVYQSRKWLVCRALWAVVLLSSFLRGCAPFGGESTLLTMYVDRGLIPYLRT